MHGIFQLGNRSTTGEKQDPNTKECEIVLLKVSKMSRAVVSSCSQLLFWHVSQP